MHNAAVIISVSVYFFIARPMSAGHVTAISGWLFWWFWTSPTHTPPHSNSARLRRLAPWFSRLRRSLYIGWQWRNFFISAVLRHFVGQALRNVCYSDVSRRHFLNKVAIVRIFS